MTTTRDDKDITYFVRKFNELRSDTSNNLSDSNNNLIGSILSAISKLITANEKANGDVREFFSQLSVLIELCDQSLNHLRKDIQTSDYNNHFFKLMISFKQFLEKIYLEFQQDFLFQIKKAEGLLRNLLISNSIISSKRDHRLYLIDQIDLFKQFLHSLENSYDPKIISRMISKVENYQKEYLSFELIEKLIEICVNVSTEIRPHITAIQKGYESDSSQTSSSVSEQDSDSDNENSNYSEDELLDETKRSQRQTISSEIDKWVGASGESNEPSLDAVEVKSTSGIIPENCADDQIPTSKDSLANNNGLSRSSSFQSVSLEEKPNFVILKNELLKNIVDEKYETYFGGIEIEVRKTKDWTSVTVPDRILAIIKKLDEATKTKPQNDNQIAKACREIRALAIEALREDSFWRAKETTIEYGKKAILGLPNIPDEEKDARNTLVGLFHELLNLKRENFSNLIINKILDAISNDETEWNEALSKIDAAIQEKIAQDETRFSFFKSMSPKLTTLLKAFSNRSQNEKDMQLSTASNTAGIKEANKTFNPRGR